MHMLIISQEKLNDLHHIKTNSINTYFDPYLRFQYNQEEDMI